MISDSSDGKSGCLLDKSSFSILFNFQASYPDTKCGLYEPLGGLTFGFSFDETLVTAVCPNADSIIEIISFSLNCSSNILINSDIADAFALLLGFV